MKKSKKKPEPIKILEKYNTGKVDFSIGARARGKDGKFLCS